MILVFNVQSMIGHALGASGGFEAIATIKAITTGWLHPTINQEVYNSTLPKISNINSQNFYIFVTSHVSMAIAFFRTWNLRLLLIRSLTWNSSMRFMLVCRKPNWNVFKFLISAICEVHTANILLIMTAISNSFGFGGHNSVLVFAPFMP